MVLPVPLAIVVIAVVIRARRSHQATPGVVHDDNGKSRYCIRGRWWKRKAAASGFLNCGGNLNSHGKTPTQTFSFSVRIRPELSLSL
ncbi:hypothetical protein BN439_2779 [Erwinia amylovora Ea644]|nr:hypothetical protein BN439_2779 [Erwinia amylovora Ea644]